MDILESLGINVEEEEKDKRKWKKVSGFMKIGRVFSFLSQTQNKNSVGDWECVKLLQLLSDKEPDTKFIIISGCDFDKLSPQEKLKLFPNQNVFYAGPGDKSLPEYMRKISIKETHECKDVYVVGGPSGTRNGNHDFGPDYKFICMNLNYTAPLYHWLNTMKIPTVYLVTDNRYYPHGFDYYTTPSVIMGQFGNENAKYVWRQKRIKDENDPTTDAKQMKKYPYDTVYAPIETVWLYKKPRPKISFEDRSDKILVVANQVVGGNNLNRRFDFIKRFFVDHDIPATLVGKWTNEKALETFKDILYDPNGVDAKTLYEKILPSYKYGVIFDYDTYNEFEGFKEQEDTWVAVKIWEYVYNGIIPIIIGYKGPYRSVPKELMVKTPAELVEKIKILNSLSNEKKERLIQKLLKDEYFDGSLLYNRIYEVRKQYGI